MTDTQEVINLINPQGKIVGYPAADAKEAVASGDYRIPTSEEQHQFNLKETYGKGTANELKAGLGGLARGASFGVSDYLLPKLGVSSQEALSSRREFNPSISLGSEIAGAVAPSLLAPESIAARTPVGLLGRGAEAVESAVTSGVGKAAAKIAGEGTLAARGLETAGRVTAKALAGAGEGAAFGAGEAISEKSLGSPEPLAESLMANIGYGAMWGGALGSLVGVGKETLPKAAEFSRDKLASGYEKLFGKAIDAPVEGGPTYAPGAIQKGVADLTGFVKGPEAAASVRELSENPELFKAMDIEEKQKFLKNSKEGLEDISAASREYSKGIFENIKPEAIQDQLGHIPIANKIKEVGEIHTVLRSAVETLESDSADYSNKYAKDLKKDLMSFESEIAKKNASAADAFNKADAIRRKLYEYKGKLSGLTDLVSSNTREVLDNAFSSVRSNLENQSFWGNSASAQAKLNAAYAEKMHAQGYVEKGFMRDMGGGKKEFDTTKLESTFNKANDLAGQEKIKHLMDWAEAEKNFIDAGNEFHQYAGVELDKEALKNRISGNVKKIEAGANRYQANKALGHGKLTDMFTLGAGMVGGIPGMVAAHLVKAIADPSAFLGKISQIDAATQKVASAVEKISKKSFEPIVATAEKSKEVAKKVLSKEEVDKKIDEVRGRVESMENTQKNLMEATKHTQDVAPDITSALQRSMIQGALFLKSKIPDWSDNTTARPFDGVPPASKAQNMMFTKYYNAVENPMMVMKEAVNGDINPEGLEVLQNVYPNLYGQMKSSLLNEIVSKKAKNKDLYMPYQKRQAISRFLGMDLDSSQNPANIMANQAILSKGRMEKKQQDNAMIKPTQGGLKEIDVADRSLTPAQKSVARQG